MFSLCPTLAAITGSIHFHSKPAPPERKMASGHFSHVTDPQLETQSPRAPYWCRAEDRWEEHLYLHTGVCVCGGGPHGNPILGKQDSIHADSERSLSHRHNRCLGICWEPSSHGSPSSPNLHSKRQKQMWSQVLGIEISANGRNLAIVCLSLVTRAFGLHPKSYGRAFMFIINNLKS